MSKVVPLSATYGNTANKLAPVLGVSRDVAQDILDRYFENFPRVRGMMLEAHTLVKKQGYVESLFGRKRRIPAATRIVEMYGDADHSQLPYEARSLLNLAVNHRIQSTGASIMNRAAISAWQTFQELAVTDPAWGNVKIVLQVHDQLVLESPEHLGEKVASILKDAMENTTELPGVSLHCDPIISKTLADQK